jgi:hypothetical protein
MKKYLIILIAIIAGVAACKKDDAAGPEVIVNSPTNGQMISSGDSVLIDFTAADEDLHEVTLTVVKESDPGVEYFADGAHVHGTETHYSEKFVAPAVVAHTNVVLNIHAEDHNGNATDKSVTFAFMP